MTLSVILLGENQKISELVKKYNDIKLLILEDNNYKKIVNSCSSDYIVFINGEDDISNDYFDKVFDKIHNSSFDICFINYKTDLKYDKNIKFEKDYEGLKSKILKKSSYLFNYIFKKDKLLNLFENYSIDTFEKDSDKIFEIKEVISDFIYFHKCDGERLINSFPLKNRKSNIYYKNIIFINNHINGNFNGLISWILNIGKCYGNKKDIVILYSTIKDRVLSRLKNLGLSMVKYDYKINYVCNNLITTSNDYYLPFNIYGLNKKILFVHAALDDYGDRYGVYEDDHYNEYYAVSKYAFDKSKKHFNTKKMSYILNPYKLDKANLRRPLNLVSAQRTSDFVKRNDRIKKMARFLDALDIPYTWNVFGDKNEGTNSSGLIYRHRISNITDYDLAADYFVILSDSEACPYSVIEALSVNTKIIATPIPALKELGIEDGKNGFYIPFEYFELGNEDKLCEKLKEIYDNKDMSFKYEYNEDNFSKYESLFID